MTATRALISAAFLVLANVPAVLAQDEGWTYKSAAYLWVSSTHLSYDTPTGTVESDISFGDSLKDLDFGFVVAAEASRGRWKLGTELMYSRTTASDPSRAGPEFSEVDTKSQSTFLTLEGSFAVLETSQVAVDLGGGFRYVRLDNDTTLRAGTSPSLSTSSVDEWVEPLAVARVRYNFAPEWYGVLYADSGFGTSDSSGSSWQVVATVGYRLNERVNIQGGWRHFVVDTNNASDLKLELSGPIIGATISF